MKDYSQLSDEALFDELDNLDMSLKIDNAMDGSGELGHVVYKSYEPFFNAIYAELDKRGLSENDHPEVDYSEVDLEEMPY